MREQSWTRRKFLGRAAGLGGAVAIGCSGTSHRPRDAGDAGDGGSCDDDPFANGTRLEDVPFVSDRTRPLEMTFGEGLDGRLYTDLAALTPETLVTPNERFYVRTRMPDRIDLASPWRIRVHGFVAAPVELSLEDLAPHVREMPATLLECSGNGGGADFGLMSAAEWTGAPLTEVLAGVGVQPAATRVLVSGFDDHSQPSNQSTPGASWVFGLDQIEEWQAFLATRMNGVELPHDHGFPVRLVVPRWYGCTCIKWVNEIQLVDDTTPSTDHMREFASRTHQDGVPELARDYRPASMDQAAMPVRIEKWRTESGALLYRVVGILWGGYEPAHDLVIRFSQSSAWEPVDVCPPAAQNRTWTLWSHAWSPPGPGRYEIALHVDDASIPQRRLDSGFYMRSVDVTEV